MKNIGFSKLNIFWKIRLCLHLLDKRDKTTHWQIKFNEDVSGSIGYSSIDGWESEYSFENDKELEIALLTIYESIEE